VIYFVQRADGAIKIGTTEHYHNRMNELRGKYGPLMLLGLMDGARPQEQQLHKQFADSRVIGDGLEWFYQTDELLAFITTNTHLTLPPPPSFVVVRDDTRRRIREFSYGLRMTMGETVEFLMGLLIPEGEDAYEYGERLRAMKDPQQD